MMGTGKPTVRKRRNLFSCPVCAPVVWVDQPWVVTNHLFGPKTFDTWDEAMAYALQRPIMINKETVNAV